MRCNYNRISDGTFFFVFFEVTDDITNMLQDVTCPK